MRIGLARTCLLVAVFCLLGGCGLVKRVFGSDPSQPIDQVTMFAPKTGQRVVVVVGGKGDSLGSMQDSGVAEAIQAQWPDADVTLAVLPQELYEIGEAMPRLRNEVIAPAKARHYKEIWLVGASLGGMGAVLYDTTYPGKLDGIVLLSPYLGDNDIQHEVRDAGGPVTWNPGAREKVNELTWQREIWRHIHEWATVPTKAHGVWLAYGDKDKFRDSMDILAPAIPKGHLLTEPGKHKWKTWTPLTGEVFQAINRERAAGH
jgi:pimeloyl-ACP methyl ester carboxylesterase